MAQGLLPALPLTRNMSSLLVLDQQVSRILYDYGEANLRPILFFFEHSGNGFFWLPVAFAAWLAGPFSKTLSCLFFNFILCLLLDLVLIGVLKAIFRRPRPVYNKGMTVFVAADHWSFPSGHASRAISICFYFWFSKRHLDSTGIQENQILIFLALLSFWGSLTALSRVFLGRHYISDVIFGAFTGFLEAYIVLHFFWLSPQLEESTNKLVKGCIFQNGNCNTQDAFTILKGAIESFPSSCFNRIS